MGRKALIAAFFVGFLMIPFSTYAEVYKWIDDKGTVHFTDDYGNIPSTYRERFKVEIREDIREEETLAGPQKIISGVKEEGSKANMFGEEETWREEKMRFWRERLQEATANYESAQKKFMEKSEFESSLNFSSASSFCALNFILS